MTSKKNVLGSMENFSYMSDNALKRNHYKPNDVILDNLHGQVVVIGYKSNDDYSLNYQAVMDAAAAYTSGRRSEAWVALADIREKDKIPSFVALETAETIFKRLRYVPTRSGTKFDGTEFWWVDKLFLPVDSGLEMNQRSNVCSSARI